DAGPARLAALLDVEQLDLEHEGGLRRDRPSGALAAIAQLGRDHQYPLAAHAHPGNALVPAADHPARPQQEGERLPARAGAVELLAAVVRRVLVVQPAGVVDRDLVTGRRHRSFARRDLDALQLRDGAAGRRRWL